MSISNSELVASREPSPLRLSWRLLLALLLGLAVESILLLATGDSKNPAIYLEQNRFYPPGAVPTLEQSIVQWQTYFSLTKSATVDALFLGDCSCALGLNPAVVQQGTGLSAWNLGTFGFFAPDDHDYLFHFYMEKKGAPRFLIYQIAYDTLTEPLTGDWGRRLREWLGPCEDNAQFLSLASFQRRSQIQNLLFNFSVRYPLALGHAKFIHHSFCKREDDLRAMLLAHRGFFIKPVENQMPDQSPPQRITGYFFPDRAQELRGLFETARQHNVRVLVTFCPMPLCAKNPQTTQTLNRLMSAVQKAARDYSNVDLWPVRYYPNRLFTSLNHLSQQGAEANTQEVNQWLEKAMKASKPSTKN